MINAKKNKKKKYISYLRKHFVIFQGDYDSLTSSSTDYTDELAQCLKDWVVTEIDLKLDDSWWKYATAAHGAAREAVGEIYKHLNGTSITHMTDLSLDPADIMVTCTNKYYDTITDNRGKSFLGRFSYGTVF